MLKAKEQSSFSSFPPLGVALLRSSFKPMPASPGLFGPKMRLKGPVVVSDRRKKSQAYRPVWSLTNPVNMDKLGLSASPQIVFQSLARFDQNCTPQTKASLQSAMNSWRSMCRAIRIAGLGNCCREPGEEKSETCRGKCTKKAGQYP